MRIMIIKYLQLAIGLFICSVILTSCNKDENNEKNAVLNLRLTDAPGSYDEVNVDIQSVEVKSNGGNVMLSVNSGVYNLLDYVNGLDTLFATGSIPSGKVSQIRLILGSNNSVVVNGTSFPLSTPSAQQSGLKLNLHEELLPGVTYAIVLDFDACQSVVEKGNGTYSLKPVIRIVNVASGGSIHGTVVPIAADPLVIAVKGSDTLSTMIDSANGEFLFSGVETGFYNVTFFPDTPYVFQTVGGVIVSTGVLTEMGTINF